MMATGSHHHLTARGKTLVGPLALGLLALGIWIVSAQLGWEPWLGWALTAALGIVLGLDGGQPHDEDPT
jgi:hypothetical protein